LIPIALLNPDEELTYKNWAKEASIGDKDAEIELRDLIASLRSKIANFQLPFLYLEPDTPKEVAIEVFVKLNTRYVRLTAFDIVAARQKPPPFEAILVWKLSRFARNREDSIIYKSLLRKQGIQVVSINEPVEDTPSGKGEGDKGGEDDNCCLTPHLPHNFVHDRGNISGSIHGEVVASDFLN